jgi:4-hydroxy-3-methylbut-2-enyl diphosphate reductase
MDVRRLDYCKMNVILDQDSGFCFGVDRAIKIAEKELNSGNSVYSLGEMVHNQVEMERLKSKGLVIIGHEDIPNLKNKTMLVRAHGEPPETFSLAEENEIKVIDATCPIVKKLQKVIHMEAMAENEAEAQIVIFGKPDHAEVVGLNGNSGNKALIIKSIDECNKIDFSKPVRLFSQTTMQEESYKQLAAEIRKRMDVLGNRDLKVHQSICRQVSGRAPKLRQFAQNHDVVVFVGGANSSNGAFLFGVCKSINANSFYVSKIEDINIEWFRNVQSVGVSGATSTPSWLICQVAEYIKTINI